MESEGNVIFNDFARDDLIVKPFVPCKNLVIEVEKLADDEWMSDFFDNLESEQITSLSLISSGRRFNRYGKYYTVPAEAFKAMCNWIKTRAPNLHRVVITDLKFVDDQPRLLKQALVAKRDQL